MTAVQQLVRAYLLGCLLLDGALRHLELLATLLSGLGLVCLGHDEGWLRRKKYKGVK